MKTLKLKLGIRAIASFALMFILTGSFLFAGILTFVGMCLSAILPMAALGLITPANLTFNGKEIRTMAEAIMESAFTNPALTDLHTIVENIVAKEQIAYLGRLSKITRKDAGCGTGVLAKSITMSQKFWNPEKVKIWLEQCADELEGSFWVWAQKKGIARKDLSGTDFAEFIMTRMEEAIIEDSLRISWFNDTAHDNVINAGLLTNGVDKLDYNIINGFWKQLFAITTTTPDRKCAIAENAAISKALQNALATDTAVKTYECLKYKSDFRLRDKSDLAIISTQSLVDNYTAYLRNVTGIEAAYKRIEGGYSSVMFEQIPVIGVNFWDRTIRADFDNGTTFDKPHRAVLTTKANLLIGVDAESEINNFDVYYERKDEKTNFKGGFKIDSKVSEDHLVQVAF